MSAITDRPAHPPRCCGSSMSPARPFTVVATRHDKDGTAVEVESTVWQCPTCGKKEGRPERWTKLRGITEYGTIDRSGRFTKLAESGNGRHRGRG